MNDIITVSYNSEQPTVLGRELHEKLMNCKTFQEFFVEVCKEKIIRDRNGLTELINIVNDDCFKVKYGCEPIVYLCDCITTEKVLPINSAETIKQNELKMQNELINNFDKAFPNMEFVGKEVVVKGIGRIDILAKQNNRYVIIELKCGSKNPNTQLLAYANYYDSPILIGITEKEIGENQKLDNVEYLTFDEIKKRVNVWIV